jgi:hypothetical protein
VLKSHIGVFERVIARRRMFLADAWKKYAAERGGICLFDDLCRLVRARVVAPGLIDQLDQLDDFGSATDVFHNSNQAVLMAIAQRGGRCVRLPDTPKNSSKCDFLIDVREATIPVEIKTLLSIGTIVLKKGVARACQVWS